MRPNESTVFAFCVQLISEFLLDPYVLEETVVKDPIGNRIVGRRRALAIDGKNRRKAEHTNPPTSHTTPPIRFIDSETSTRLLLRAHNLHAHLTERASLSQRRIAQCNFHLAHAILPPPCPCFVKILFMIHGHPPPLRVRII